MWYSANSMIVTQACKVLQNHNYHTEQKKKIIYRYFLQQVELFYIIC